MRIGCPGLRSPIICADINTNDHYHPETWLEFQLRLSLGAVEIRNPITSLLFFGFTFGCKILKLNFKANACHQLNNVRTKLIDLFDTTHIALIVTDFFKKYIYSIFFLNKENCVEHLSFGQAIHLVCQLYRKFCLQIIFIKRQINLLAIFTQVSPVILAKILLQANFSDVLIMLILPI